MDNVSKCWHATPTRTWEYKVVEEAYQYKEQYGRGTYLDSFACREDGAKVIPCDGFLDKLGAQGWELVCIYPDSTQAGPNMAGVTSLATYTFKS